MKLITPWNLKDIKRADDLQAIALVKEHLYKRGFNVDQWVDASEQVRKATTVVLSALFKQEQTILIVMCNSLASLTSLSSTLPIVFSLTKRVASCRITTSGMLDLFMSKEPTDIWESYPAGEVLTNIENSGLVVWSLPNAKIAWAIKQEGRFLKVISSRQGQKKMIMLVKTSSKGRISKNAITDTAEQLSEALGILVSGSIAENANFHGLYVETPNPSFTYSEV